MKTLEITGLKSVGKRILITTIDGKVLYFPKKPIDVGYRKIFVPDWLARKYGDVFIERK